MNEPIIPGYYAMAIGDCYESLEGAFHTKERLVSARAALMQSPHRWVVSDDRHSDDLFYAFQVIPPGDKVVVMMGDRRLRGDTPGDAYAKTSSEMIGLPAAFVVVWLGEPPKMLAH